MWYKLKRILIYPDGVTEKQVYPSTKWKPWANTILYLPLDIKNWTTDLSWNYIMTSWTISTVWGVECFHWWKNLAQIETTTNFDMDTSKTYTINFRWKSENSNWVDFLNMWIDSVSNYNFFISSQMSVRSWTNNYTHYEMLYSIDTARHNFCVILLPNANPIVYIDLVQAWSSRWWSWSTYNPWQSLKICDMWHSSWTWYVSRVIVEKEKQWDIVAINEYYNNTKWLYS